MSDEQNPIVSLKGKKKRSALPRVIIDAGDAAAGLLLPVYGVGKFGLKYLNLFITKGFRKRIEDLEEEIGFLNDQLSKNHNAMNDLIETNRLLCEKIHKSEL